DCHAIVRRARSMLMLAERLRLHVSQLPDRLLGTARAEPMPIIRQRAFHLLFTHYSAHPSVRRKIELILRDPDPLVRLLAAQSEGPDGLVRVEAMAIDVAIPIEVRTIAYCYLVQFAAANRADVLELIHTALDDETPRLIETLVQFIGTLRAYPLANGVARALV